MKLSLQKSFGEFYVLRLVRRKALGPVYPVIEDEKNRSDTKSVKQKFA